MSVCPGAQTETLSSSIENLSERQLHVTNSEQIAARQLKLEIERLSSLEEELAHTRRAAAPGDPDAALQRVIAKLQSKVDLR
jgi:hypothetical protein